MIAAAVAGALGGAGVLLLLRALAGTRPSLAARLSAVEAPARPVAGRYGGGGSGIAAPHGTSQARWAGALGTVREQLARRGLSQRLLDTGLRTDLDMLGIDPAAYAARKVLTVLAVVAAGSGLLVPLAVATGLPWLGGAWCAVLAGAAAFVRPDVRVRGAAAAQRRDFLTTLTTYLDLVAMRAASGAGIPEALRDAAGIGTGYGWRRLQAAMQDARLDGRSPASGLARLGQDIGLGQLDELASQLTLVDATGAQAEATLRAKAEALREEALTTLHGDANARSQSMVLGQAALAVGFLVLLGYPALAAVLAV